MFPYTLRLCVGRNAPVYIYIRIGYMNSKTGGYMKFIGVFALFSFLTTTAHSYTKDKLYKISILHTNDHHGRFLPNKEGESGLAARATLIQSLREQVKSEGGQVLLLDAGDINTGTPQSDLQNAEPDFKGMSLLKYDMMVVGNHEFDNSL